MNKGQNKTFHVRIMQASKNLKEMRVKERLFVDKMQQIKGM
jgi:hypothetical protein